MAAVTLALVELIAALAHVSYAPTLAFNVAMLTLAAVTFARKPEISFSCVAAFAVHATVTAAIAALAAVTFAFVLLICVCCVAALDHRLITLLLFSNEPVYVGK